MTNEHGEEITTPGNMMWVPCNHAHSVKDRFGRCEACRGTGRTLMLVSQVPIDEKRVLP